MTDMPPDQDRPRVRHATTGDLGTLERIDRTVWADWALVRWDDDGPGLVNGQGLAVVAPGLLEPGAPPLRAVGARAQPKRRRR